MRNTIVVMAGGAPYEQRVRAHVGVMDGLRAVAIMWVVAYHVWQLSWIPLGGVFGGWAWGVNPLVETGFTGVELFFFISGFCLFYPYVRAIRQHEPVPRLGHFWYRRGLKILPSYWLAIIGILVVIRPAWLQEPGVALWNILSHLLFLHNFSQSTVISINGVFWSLAVEVQFYLLFPVLAWWFGKRPFVTCLAMTVVACLWRVYPIVSGKLLLGHYWIDQLPGFLDLFAAGMLTAHLVPVVQRLADNRKWVGWLCAVLTPLMMYVIWQISANLWDAREAPHWPWHWQATHRHWWGFAFTLWALVLTQSGRFWVWLFTNRVVTFFSLISYNLYIHHQWLGRQMMYQWHWPPYVGQDPHADAHWQWVFTGVVILCSIVLAALLTYAFERPLLRQPPQRIAGLWRRICHGSGASPRIE